MSITSLGFALFVIASVILFIIFPRNFRWISLLISSMGFYLISDMNCVGFILLTSFTVWFGARMMDRLQTQADEKVRECVSDRNKKKQIKEAAQRKKKTVLLCVLIINIGILVFLKIIKLFSSTVVALAAALTGGSNVEVWLLVMPLGISYYTFSTVGYLLDVYWKRYHCENNYARFLLYASYYPHIIQGPISRYDKLGTELKQKELRLKWDNLKCGLELILWGLFKKLVIADRISIFVNNTLHVDYDAGFNGSVYLLAIALDAIQIYADFSGYMDIVSGVSQFFDVQLEKNFNHPFMSSTVPEFWRRWHMSLGSWFKDYVYYPITVSGIMKKLTKAVRGKVPARILKLILTVIPVMITWILTGLWHGTGMGYLMWGLYYGTLITLSVTFSDIVLNWQKKLHINTDCFSWRLFQHVKIFLIFMGGRFLGNSLGISMRIIILQRIFGSFSYWEFFDGTMLRFGLDGKNFFILVVGVLLMVLVSNLQEKYELRKVFNRQNFVFQALILAVGIFTVFLLGIYGTGYDTGGFMYQQF